MILTHEQLQLISDWQSAFPGFHRDDGSAITDRIRPGIQRLVESGKWRVRVVHDAGMENFYGITVRPYAEPKSTIHNVYPRGKGLLVYFNLFSPVAAVSRAEVLTGDDIIEIATMSPSDVICPTDESDELMADFLNAFQNSGYKFSSREELCEPIPKNVKFDGFCYGRHPWDRVFHVLFHAND